MTRKKPKRPGNSGAELQHGDHKLEDDHQEQRLCAGCGLCYAAMFFLQKDPNEHPQKIQPNCYACRRTHNIERSLASDPQETLPSEQSECSNEAFHALAAKRLNTEEGYPNSYEVRLRALKYNVLEEDQNRIWERITSNPYAREGIERYRATIDTIEDKKTRKRKLKREGLYVPGCPEKRHNSAPKFELGAKINPMMKKPEADTPPKISLGSAPASQPLSFSLPLAPAEASVNKTDMTRDWAGSEPMMTDE